MEVSGRVHNGVVVLEDPESLPEGAAVTVVLRAAPPARRPGERRRLKFPLVRSKAPGSVHLTNDMIGDILDAEDAPSGH